MEQVSQPTDLSTEFIKRRYLPEFIKDFKREIVRGTFDGDDVARAHYYVNLADEALDELKKGDNSKVKEIIFFDLQRTKALLQVYKDPTTDIEAREILQSKINRLNQLLEGL